MSEVVMTTRHGFLLTTIELHCIHGVYRCGIAPEEGSNPKKVMAAVLEWFDQQRDCDCSTEALRARHG